MTLKKIAAAALVAGSVVTLASCSQAPADVVSENISKEAEKFQVRREVLFINTVTGDFIKEIDGFCNIDVDEGESQLEVTCKTPGDLYLKHFLHLSETTAYAVEQLDPSKVSADHYTVILNPSVLVPNVDVK